MPNNLPHQLTSFVGRAHEVEETGRLLRSARLATLTGMGGLGKTRLALQVASLLQNDYPGGVWLVELAALTDPRLVPHTVAATLAVREQPDQPVESTLITYLQPLKLLLLLDNCEHLLEACANLAHTLLRSCPTLTILATSRQGLGIEGEACLRVPALAVPEPAGQTPLETLYNSEAVQLFMDRARLRRSDFALTTQNAASVARLCHRLDGIPLAIELAAARINVLSVEQIMSRLDERFHLLATSSQIVIARHKTLEATLDWSYELLADKERVLFRAMSVFSGGFNLDALEEVIADQSPDLDALETLTQLADKSLVQVDQSGHEARYTIVETIREYAEQKARLADETSHLREKHLAWCVRLAEQTEDGLVSDRQALWLTRLEQEHDNLRAALTFALGGTYDRAVPTANPSHISYLALRLAGALVWFWYFRGYISEGRGWLEGALAVVGRNKRDVPLAKALSASGVFAYLQNDLDAAQSQLEESLSIWSDLEDKRGTAFASAFLGRTLVDQGSPQGRAYIEQSVSLFRAINDKWGQALSLDFLGEEAHEAGDNERAAILHDESLALYRELGHQWGVALEMTYFAQVALRRGEYANARTRLEEAAKIQREVGDKRMLAWTLMSLGEALYRDEETSDAERLYIESLALFREVGERIGLASMLHKMAAISVHKGDYEVARQQLQESLALARELGDQRAVVQCLLQLEEVARLRGESHDADRYHNEARELAHTLGDPITIGESDGVGLAQRDAAERRNSDGQRIDDLTGREIEVLRLMAEGLTDAQIAQQLVLSTRTVQAHIRSIYSKLDISTRSAATRYAIEQRLA